MRESVTVRWNDRTAGRLAINEKGLCIFEYSGEQLETGVSLSPFELPLKQGIFTARPTPFDGGFGVFDDSLPDGWGMLILDRYLRKQGIDVRKLNILERLSLVGSTGRGALEFIPDKSIEGLWTVTDFKKLASEASKILGSEQYDGEGIEDMMKRGGSPGGARPKIFTKCDGKEWLVKFKAREDPDNIGEIEYQYSRLARECGVEMPETRLFEDRFFGVERFDRIGERKLHVVSIAGLLRADYRIPSIDYSHIFKVCSALTKETAEKWKIFRLMVFNYLIGNKDDHAKNFAFIYRDGAWHFAPAFDILPSYGLGGYHTTSINDRIEPTKEDLIEVGVKNGLGRKGTEKIYEEIYEKVGTFRRP